MADSTVDNQIPAHEGDSPQPPPDAQGRKPRKAVKFLVMVVLLVAAALGAYKLGWLAAAIRQVEGIDAEAAPKPAFTKSAAGNLLSAANLFEDVGSSPIDPSKVLFPAFNKPPNPASEDKPIACPPGSKEPSGDKAAPDTAKTAPEESRPTGAASPHRALTSPDRSAPRLVETPVIVSRRPGDRGSQENKGGKPGSKAQASKPEAKSPSEKSASKPRDGAGAAKGPDVKTASESSSALKSQTELGKDKEPKYEPPGSLLVKIKNYKGSTVKWGLMVILDDSASMGRKTKLWNPNRIETARGLVEKLPESLTAGSKLAVRDFMCGKSTRKRGFCLSHTVFDWSSSPFKELKDKLATVKKDGRNNPCAAAAYAIKRDMGELGGLVPRVLIVTNGLTKCSYNEVLKAVGSHGGKGKPVVDVIGVGMGPRNSRGYAGLAKKTGGVFLRVERPSDMDRVVSRYGKVLKTRALEKLEVRGENAVHTATPDKEISLTPGTYKVVLPLVGKLHPSHRSIPEVKINSGETKIVVVRIKNGRPTVRFVKK